MDNYYSILDDTETNELFKCSQNKLYQEEIHRKNTEAK